MHCAVVSIFFPLAQWPEQFFFVEPEMHHNGVVWAQDYRMLTLMQPKIQVWMVKPLSAGCVNTVVAH